MTKKSAGFTLIEVLVVTALVVMLLVGATGMFLGFMAGAAKNNARQKIKDEGNNALTQIEYLLRNSRRVESCSSASSPNISFSTLGGEVLTISRNGNRLYLTSTNPDTGSLYLSGEETVATSLGFQCFQSASGKGQYVEVNFSLRNGATVDSASVEEDFSSGVLLRNTSF